MKSLTLTEARAALSDVLDRVEAGEEVTITRHGRPVALVVRPDRVRSQRAAAAFAEADRLGSRLDAARRRRVSTDGLSVEQAEELVASIRADRDAS